MSELNFSRHIHIPTSTEYVAGLTYQQRLAYMSFCLLISHPNDSISKAALRELWGNRPAIAGKPLTHSYYRTLDNTLLVVGSTQVAHNHLDDHLVIAASLQDDTMHVDELEITEITHAKSSEGTFHKIIDAKWNEASKLIGLRLGGQALLLEKNQHGGATQCTLLENITSSMRH